MKEQSCNNFCLICRCNIKSFYRNFKRRVSIENLLEISKQAEVKKSRLAELVTELGFSISSLSLCKTKNKAEFSL